jgi:small-conductance mechanosensitive channel
MLNNHCHRVTTQLQLINIIIIIIIICVCLFVCRCVFPSQYIYTVREEKHKIRLLCCTLQAVGTEFFRQFCLTRVSGFVLRMEVCREYRFMVGLCDVYIKQTSECK